MQAESVQNVHRDVCIVKKYQKLAGVNGSLKVSEVDGLQGKLTSVASKPGTEVVMREAKTSSKHRWK